MASAWPSERFGQRWLHVFSRADVQGLQLHTDGVCRDRESLESQGYGRVGVGKNNGNAGQPRHELSENVESSCF
jgi:hypothetical protein